MYVNEANSMAIIHWLINNDLIEWCAINSNRLLYFVPASFSHRGYCMTRLGRKTTEMKYIPWLVKIDVWSGVL